jgi:Peroxisomal membrane protein (Pex16)
MPLLRVYADFVKAHPGLVQNVERLAHWVVYATPDRFSSSEYAYEGFIAALGLLGLLNESILAGETPGLDSSARAAAIWLAAVEQVWRVELNFYSAV